MGATSRSLTKQQREAPDHFAKDILGIAHRGDFDRVHDNEVRLKTQAKGSSSVSVSWWGNEQFGKRRRGLEEVRSCTPTADPFAAFADARLPVMEQPT